MAGKCHSDLLPPAGAASECCATIHLIACPLVTAPIAVLHKYKVLPCRAAPGCRVLWEHGAVRAGLQGDCGEAGSLQVRCLKQ